KGLVDVAAAALALRHRALPRVTAPADPAFDIRTADVVVTPLEAPEVRLRLRADTSAPWVAEPPPRLHVYSGADRSAVLDALAAGRESLCGPARLVLLGADRAPAARTWLTRGGPQPDGVAFRATPIGGEVGFVFTGGLAAYPGMGREVLLAFPRLGHVQPAGGRGVRGDPPGLGPAGHRRGPVAQLPRGCRPGPGTQGAARRGRRTPGRRQRTGLGGARWGGFGVRGRPVPPGPGV